MPRQEFVDAAVGFLINCRLGDKGRAVAPDERTLVLYRLLTKGCAPHECRQETLRAG